MREKGRETLEDLLAEHEVSGEDLSDDDRAEVTGPIDVSPNKEMSSADEEKLSRLAARARAATKRGVELILEIKEILAEAYELHDHVGRASTFGAWVAENLPDLTERTVQRYLKIHKVFGAVKTDTLSRFDVTALYILSEDKVAVTSREMALLIAEGGGRITAAAARQFASNPWNTGDRRSLPARQPAQRLKQIRIAIEGGEVVIKPKTTQLTVAAALEQAATRWTQAENG
jgi:hypothetical protein